MAFLKAFSVKKTIRIASTAATLAVSPFAGAALATLDDRREHHLQMSAEDAQALIDARVVALRAGLDLTPAQEKNWAPLEALVRHQARQRTEPFAEGRLKRNENSEYSDALQRLQRISERLFARATDLRTLSEAARPLYESLDKEQKRRFGRLLLASINAQGSHAET
ncbi:conserved exported hypothetical protein [Methylocella tundrae]|uniref:LTXXQ motif family protein n=1 Tax=Methylocella tundrae TaxID=227605 RepID=A0A8B6M6I4_METTU|nr:conserved exported hypothetical protein [Methylocella tundrae]